MSTSENPQPGIAIHLNCPHCHSPIELASGALTDEILCPSCGSSFRLDPDRTRSWSKDTLPKLGKFELLEPVGRGAFGTVYRARDTQLERIVAVKVPRSGQLATDEDEERFVREARNAAQLLHPGIVPVYEVGRGAMFPYIVCEFVDGSTLADILTARKFGFRESARLAAQVAEALDHAHAHGVVHRDLKPSNIMITPDGQPRVMDFGMAKRDAGEVTVTVEGQVLGTPAYMSPEQAAGQAHHVDGRSDIYSLGSILYELLTGELPFRGNQRMLLQQVLHDEPRAPHSLNDGIPRDLETISLKAMAKEPSRRYQTAQAMADDLQRFLTGQPIAARPVGRVERAWRWCRRNPTVAGLSAAVVAALVSGTIVSGYFAADAISQKRLADQRAVEAMASAQSAEQAKTRADQQRAKAVEAQQLEAQQRQRAQEAEAQATKDAQRAQAEAEKAVQVAQFLTHMFEESAPFAIGGVRFGISQKGLATLNLTAREILDSAAQRVDDELRGQPLIQAALKDTMGNVYLGLGVTEKAEPLLEEAFRVRQKHLPREHLDVASSLHSIGVLRFVQTRFVESAEAHEETLAIRRKLLGDNNKLVDDTRIALSSVLALYRPRGWRDSTEAVELARESLSWRQKQYGKTHRETALAMLVLAGGLLLTVGGEQEAAMLLAGAGPILLNDPVTKPFGIAIGQFIQAILMGRLGRHEAAAEATRKGIAAARQVLGDQHPLMFTMTSYAIGNFLHAGQFDEAEKLCREWLDNPQHSSELSRFANVKVAKYLVEVRLARYAKTHDPMHLNEAAKSYSEYISMVQTGHIDVTNYQVRLLLRLGSALEANNRVRAESVYRDAIKIIKDSLASQRDSKEGTKLDVSQFADSALELAQILVRRGKPEEAEALYREFIDLAAGRDEFSMMRVTMGYGDFLRQQHKFSEAHQLYLQSFELAERLRGNDEKSGVNWMSGISWRRATCLVALDKKAEAEQVFRNVIALGDEYWKPRALASLATCLQGRGAGGEARALLHDALSTHVEGASYDAWLAKWNNLYQLMERQGVEKAALVALVDEVDGVLAEARKRLGSEHVDVAAILVNVGDALVRLGEFQRAEPMLREGREIRRKVLPTNDSRHGTAELFHGQCLIGLERYGDAEPLLLSGYAQLLAAYGPNDERTVRAARQLVRLYEALKQREKTEEYRKLLPSENGKTPTSP